ncbi:AsmA family protein [Roseovarius sp. LXJ103]|uniref:AsmA family protein n=1 Tax=Roseovarius carneus TaxID=2853164 RepID=UPI000D61B704|nr:AsmA family protein [Roseovarius carneus]MBZ8117122.1 AsmA family protein [Roseovarius carneus]PWE37034.1 AsmA family protein [Pelagicola sp. LXJ1103]
MKFLAKLIGFALVIVLIMVGALFFLPGDRIARIAADQISSITGRDVTMTGDTEISFYPVLGISTGPTTIAGAEWSDGPAMLAAQSLKVGVDPLALLRGDIRITGLEVVEPAIYLERGADGRVNWEIGVEGVAPSGQSEGAVSATNERLALTLDRAVIREASLIFVDRAAGTRTEQSGMDLDLRWPDYEGEATFEATLRPKGSAVSIDGSIEKVGTMIEGGVSGLSATISTNGGTVEFVGRGSSAPQLDGRLIAKLSDTKAFFASLGVAAADIPRGFGQSIDAQTQITVTGGDRIALRDLGVTLDQNRLTGAIDINLAGDRPRITAQLNAGALDLSSLESGSSAEASGGGGTAVSDGWSKTPIDASALGLVDAEMSLSADSLDLGTLQFGATRILVTLDRARGVFQFQELQGYGGRITGQFVANNRAGLSVGGDLSATGMDMERLLTDAAGITRFATTGAASLDFLGVGGSIDQIMKSLQGNLSLSTGRGVISGFDLDKLMRSGDGTGGTTVFDAMSASFAIAGGNMLGDDLSMSLPLATATGKGRIGLGAQDIDYVFTPVLLQGESRRGLAIPVKIRGPWADPRIWPDLEGALDLNFKEEAEKLEQQVKDEVDREVDRFVEKELGVTRQEGESVEDAIRKEVEDTVVRELFKLFD